MALLGSLVFASAPALAAEATSASTASTPAASSSAASSDSGAEGEKGHVSAALLVGNGFKDGYNLGFGARVGYTLPMNLYVGGTFVYHLGKSTDGAGGSSSKVNLYYFGGEAGYNVSAGPVILRPYLGIGYATATAKVDLPKQLGGASVSASDSKVYFAPGATVLYPIGSLSVGADARYVVISDLASFAAFATVGMKF